MQTRTEDLEIKPFNNKSEESRGKSSWRVKPESIHPSWREAQTRKLPPRESARPVLHPFATSSKRQNSKSLAEWDT